MNGAASVRRASSADIAAVVPLFDAYRQFYGQASDPLLAFKFLSARLSADESVVFLAEETAAAVGFVQLFPSFSSAAARKIFILNDLFVAEAVRGRGVARQLIEAAARFAAAAGAARVKLATAADNHAAQALYEATSWRRDEAFLTYNLILED